MGGTDVIPYLHSAWGALTGTSEGRNHRWEGRDPLNFIYMRVWGAIVLGSVVSLEFVHMGFYTFACFRATCLPKHNPLQLASSQVGSGECIWLAVGLCANGAATRARFWGRIRIWKLHSWWWALNVSSCCYLGFVWKWGDTIKLTAIKQWGKWWQPIQIGGTLIFSTIIII